MNAFTATEACQRTGVTYRQLDYWDRRGLCIPSVNQRAGSGSHRLYSSDDLRILRILRTVMGLSNPTGRRGVDCDATRRGLALARNPEGCRWLVVTDTDAALVAAGEVEQVLKGGAVVVDLEAMA